MISEIAVKFVVPITNMILTRILTPDAFGVVAICNMLISFIDLISDAGFGKYIIQAEFSSEEEKDNYINVAFWTNFLISLFMVIIIILFRDYIAGVLGNKGYARVISISGLQIIITTISSIQISILRRNCDFKKLFIARLSVAIIPLIITVPIAIVMKSFWALIIGNLFTAAFNSAILSVLSRWKPKLFYRYEILKKMFNYSFWSLCEAVANWTIFWIDTFIVGRIFSEYQLGLYKNSAYMVQSIMGMLSASVSPVLLTILSKLKCNDKKFRETFINIQNLILYLAIPMGIGLFIFRKTATIILFGYSWIEAADIVGAWSIMMMFSVIFYSMPAELYKSKGIPRMLFIFQVMYLVVLVPICYFSTEYGFWAMVYIRCICVIWQVILSIIFIRKIFKINLYEYFSTFFIPIMGTLCMACLSIVYKLFFDTLLSDILGIIVGILVYISFIIVFARKEIYKILKILKDRDIKIN